MSEVVELYVGEDHRVAGLLQGHITYAGMLSEQVYSIVHKREVKPEYAYNLFYPVNSREISLAGVKVHVEAVDADRIRFRIDPESARQAR